MSASIKDRVSAYYTSRLQQFGETPRGVDWNSTDSQILRFQQLCRVIPDHVEQNFTLLDFGCGYGAMLEFLSPVYPSFRYRGFDISSEMISSAKTKFRDFKNATWFTSENELSPADFTIASGIFNVKMDFGIAEWEQYILNTLDIINRLSVKGFSFNVLTSYSDREFMKNNLYYASPSFFFDHCKKNFSRHVALLHDYPLYEFTIIVRKL